MVGRARPFAVVGCVAVVMASQVVAGCGKTVTAPDVVGMRLDAAHRAFEALGVDEFDDRDVIGKKDSILRDANWVVVAQSPRAGATDVSTGTKVKLSVGNESDSEVLERIPADSPFAVEAAKAAKKKKEERAADERREAAEKKAATAKRAKDAKGYAEKIDGSIGKTVPKLVDLYVTNADMVHANGGGPVVAAQNALASRDSFERILSSLSSSDLGPPKSLSKVKSLKDVDDRLRDAMAGFVVASKALIDAIDTQAPSAFAKELTERKAAIEDWNAAMRAIYGAADRKPVLIPQ